VELGAPQIIAAGSSPAADYRVFGLRSVAGAEQLGEKAFHSPDG